MESAESGPEQRLAEAAKSATHAAQEVQVWLLPSGCATDAGNVRHEYGLGLGGELEAQELRPAKTVAEVLQGLKQAIHELMRAEYLFRDRHQRFL